MPTTLQLNRSVEERLTPLSTSLNVSLDQLVNEVLEDFIKKSTEPDLQQIISRLQTYHHMDPNFDKAIAQFVNAEASLGSADPVDGSQIKKASVQSAV